MVEGLRRIAMKLEMPKVGVAAAAAASLQDSGAGDELAASLAARGAALRAKRQALGERADVAERRFAAEVRACDALAAEWRAFRGAVGALGALGAELRGVRVR